jgi:drug/metabolite transporter (DMT)-like permease
MSNTRLLGIAAGSAAAASWGSGMVLSKKLLLEFEPHSLLLIQLATSVIVLWGVVICRTKCSGMRPASFRWAIGYAWLGSIEPALAYFLALAGLVGATASGATLIQAAESIMIVGVTAIMTRKLPSVHFLGLSFLALLGLSCALNVDGLDVGRSSSPTGIVLLIAGTLSAAVYVVLSGRVARRAPALTIVAAQHSVALALLILIAVFSRFLGGLADATHSLILVGDTVTRAKGVLFCAIGGLLQFALPFPLYMIALQRLPANLAGALLLLTPLMGLVEAHLFLGEQLTVRQWSGSIVALAAVAGLGLINSHQEASGATSLV